MAKEMMIIFVYDTQLIKREEDDPATAILYFHPGWVSDQQRTALCGQIMGTTHFFKSVFTSPKIVSLQSGKFFIHEYGRYILAVGTDRNIADWVLEYRANTLSSLITFFHNDLEVMAQLYDKNLSAKLYHMFETYLKILTYSSNLFSNIPTIQLPKSASNVFLEAIQILQCCQEVDHVLGGTMLYHNKVVATQLSSNLTKRLVLTDPYRIKSPAESVHVNYQLPIGVQLLHVYIEGKDYQDLLEDATRSRTVHQYLTRKTSTKKVVPSKEPVIAAMKRDQSIIFTTVPEEDIGAHSPINIEHNIIRTKPLTRPKFLNLRNKTTDTKPEQKPTKPIPVTTPFHGQTSICSTPMTDLNKVLHQNIMSICIDPNEEIEKESPKKSKNNTKNKDLKSCAARNQENTTINEELRNKLKQNILKEGHNFKQEIERSVETISTLDAKDTNFKNKQLNTMQESEDIENQKMHHNLEKAKNSTNERIKNEVLNESFKTDSLNSVLSAISGNSDTSLHSKYKTPYFTVNQNMDIKNTLSMLDIRFKNDEILDNRPNISKTITDPTFPVFKSDGSLVSESLYGKYLNKHVENLNKEILTNSVIHKSTVEINQANSETNTDEFKSFEDFDTAIKYTKNDEIEMILLAKIPETKPKEARKALSLPLKSLSTDSDPSLIKNRNVGVQLTPLMSKLSLLAMEERSSGFCSRDTTPSEYKDYRFTPTHANYSFCNPKKANTKNGKFRKQIHDKLKKGVLFICGQQDMVVGVLLEENACQSPEVVNKLWETGIASLSKLEKQLRTCLETYPGGNANQTETGEPYSYLSMDQHWDTVQRGGPWGGLELGALTHLHRDFTTSQSVTEILLRDDDSIIYGHNCGKTEVYYHQSANSNAGLPTPADPMGVVPLKAKRRLERDHAIILL